MPVTKNQLLRIRVIDRVLRNKFRTVPATKEYLRDQCVEELYGIDSGQSGNEVSLSTIDKDLRLMREEYDAPIAYDRGSKEYYYEKGSYSLDGLGVGSREWQALESAAQFLSGFTDNPLLRQFAPAIHRLRDRLSLQKKQMDEDHIIEFEALPEYEGWANIDRLFQSIKDCSVIEFDYFYFDSESTRRVCFHPYLLKESKQRWYVVGFSPERNAMRLYGLERIKNLEILNERYPLSDRKGFDSADYFKHTYGIFTLPDSPPSRVEVYLDRKELLFAKSKPWHSSQEIIRENSVGGTVAWKLHITPDFIMELLALGDRVEVLKPESLRNQISNSLKKAVDRYGRNVER